MAADLSFPDTSIESSRLITLSANSGANDIFLLGATTRVTNTLTIGYASVPTNNATVDILAVRATNQYTIAAVNLAANRIYSLQDVGVDSNFLMTDALYYNTTLNQGVAPSTGYRAKFWRGTSSTTSGLATFNITADGTARGAALFSSLTTDYLGNSCQQHYERHSNAAVLDQVSICNPGAYQCCHRRALRLDI